ncbi:hypothetical protein AVEN_64288-1 [Araneus ventricosus]|uniref:Uncharacterized protein n=1 Tax=Araneus ventricosus TaxID=182803 RepID=A0A4Y2GDQ5_ARAVE|nr:hypothetical protein AVEN_64288-1 [Araneus ventricosus]
MVRVWRRPHEAMDPSCQQGAAQVGGGSIIVWAVFTWHRLGPMAKLNQSWNGNCYVRLLGVYLQPFMDPNSDGNFTRLKSFAIGLRNILDNSSECLGHLDRQT